MFNFAENALVTISPNYPQPKCGATRFRWQMHAPLPFVIPSVKCLSVAFDRSGKNFTAGFHNHYDRETRTKAGVPGAAPIVRLVPKAKDGEAVPPPPADYTSFREYLQSVVIIVEDTEYVTVLDAFKGADKKIQDCFGFLGEYLGRLQRSLPYMLTWTLYPASVFDVGVVHHSVDYFCPNAKNWVMIGGGIALSLARQLRAPLFVADLNELEDVPADVDLANELLAEAQLAIFRRLPRLAVLNSFTALESLANAVYRTQRTRQLEGWGVPTDRAELIAEEERHRHRTDEKFLLGSGMKDASARSLTEDNKTLYDELVRLEKNIRHQVSHRGTRPSLDEARACFRACCEGVRWLCEVAGYPKKEMLAPPERSAGGFNAGSTTPCVCSAAEMEVLRRMFGIFIPELSNASATDDEPNAPPDTLIRESPDGDDRPTVAPE